MLARWAECSAELRQVFRYSMEYFAVSRHLGQTDIPVTRCQWVLIL
ncbi:mCG146911 [Mus musculus]|nr:mCG146911 [Mus musculus]